MYIRVMEFEYVIAQPVKEGVKESILYFKEMDTNSEPVFTLDKMAAMGFDSRGRAESFGEKYIHGVNIYIPVTNKPCIYKPIDSSNTIVVFPISEETLLYYKVEMVFTWKRFKKTDEGKEFTLDLFSAIEMLKENISFELTSLDAKAELLQEQQKKWRGL